MTMNENAKKPKCKLTGTDGNAFAIIANVSRCLKKAGLNELAAEFRSKALASKSYDALLVLCSDYVDVR